MQLRDTRPVSLTRAELFESLRDKVYPEWNCSEPGTTLLSNRNAMINKTTIVPTRTGNHTKRTRLQAAYKRWTSPAMDSEGSLRE